MNPWYPFYPGDYLRDTAHLALVEHGAYRRLLDHYYSTGSPLPKEEVALYRLAGAFDENERAAVDSVLAKFFELKADGYHNRRADREIADRVERQANLSRSGRNGAQKRWSKPDSHPNSQANGHPNGQAIARPQPEPLPDPYPKPEGRCASHTPLPSAPAVCEAAVAAWNDNRGPLPAVQRLTGDRQKKLRSRVKANPEFLEVLAAATRKAADTPFLCGAGERGWKADFDWMIKNDTNAVAVLEGKYEQATAKENYGGHRNFDRTDRAAQEFLDGVKRMATKVGSPV